jgi:hypothetical protein
MSSGNQEGYTGPIVIQISGPPEAPTQPVAEQSSHDGGFGDPNKDVSKAKIRQMEGAHNRDNVEKHPDNQPGFQGLLKFALDHAPKASNRRLAGVAALGLIVLVAIGINSCRGGSTGPKSPDPLYQEYGRIIAAGPSADQAPTSDSAQEPSDEPYDGSGFFAENDTCIAEGTRTIGELARPDTLQGAVMLIDRMDQPGYKAACYQLGSDATRQLMGLPKGTVGLNPNWPVRIPQTLKIK